MPLPAFYRKVAKFILRGTAASRPAVADTLPGSVYYSSDTEVLERSDGSAWQTVSPQPRHIGCAVYKDTTQTVADNTYTVVDFEAESYDTDAIHSTSSNKGRFTAPLTGYYALQCGIGFLTTGYSVAPPAGAQLGLKVRKNGTTDIPGSGTFNPALTKNSNQWVFTTIALALTAGDYIEVMAYQDTTLNETISIYGDATPSNFVTGARFQFLGR